MRISLIILLFCVAFNAANSSPLVNSPKINKNRNNEIEIQPSTSLKYGRIKLITHLNPKVHKTLIDSIFIQVNESLQKIELQIGYKLTADVEFMLFTDLAAYQQAYRNTKIYCEQHNLPQIYNTEKILPLFVAQRFQAIKSDIRFLVSYILLDEFLHGVGVKQRLNQGDAVRLPLWLIHGYCSLNAAPWSAKDADQYLLFSKSGYYENIHKIPNEAQATFGKYVWFNILISKNKNIESTIWFTVKYTNQLNEAFLFQYKQTFDEWFLNLPVISLKYDTQSSDISIPDFFVGKTIQNITTSKSNSCFLLLSDEIGDKLVFLSASKEQKIISEFISNDQINPWYRKNEYQLWYDSLFNTFNLAVRMGISCYVYSYNDEADIIDIDSFTVNLEDVNCGLTFSIHKVLSTNYQEFLKSISSSIIETHSEGYSVKKDNHYLLVISSIKQNKSSNADVQPAGPTYVLSTYRIQNKLFTLLRSDSFNKLPIIGSVLMETENRISYSIGNNNFWKLTFIEFNKEDDLQWNTGSTLQFFRHFKDYRNQILECGIQSKFPIVRILDNWQESKQEIIKLYKQSEVESKVPTYSNPDSIYIKPTALGFYFISNFPVKSWTSKTKQQLLNQYIGDYDIQLITPGYYLKHAGVYLSNYENRNFTYYNKLPLKNLINSPFTPNIRLHIADKLNHHNLTMRIYSNITGSRLGMELNQQVDLKNKFTFIHSLLWRNRNFLSDENNLIRNSSLSNHLGISRDWFNLITATIDGEIRYDAFYSRISSISQTITPSSKDVLGSLFFSLGYNSLNSSNQTSLKRWNLQTKLTAGSTYFGPSNEYNFLFKFDGATDKSIGKHWAYKNRFSGTYSLGKTQTLYLLGGTDGWINSEQFIEKIPAMKSTTNFNMIGFGLPVRGFLFGSRVGSSFFSIQQQIEIELFKSLIKNQIRNIFISDLTLYFFGDAGMAFIDKSPNSLSNPYHTKQISSSNYQLWYTSLHSPWISSFGFGISTYIMGFPLKYEFAVPNIDKKLQKSQHLIGLQWDF